MYPEHTRATICERIAAGESLRAICRDDDMPSVQSVMNWLDSEPEFCSRYARAREKQADAIFDGMAEIEDDVKSGELRPDAARVILESRRWRAEKLKPKAYGSKIEATHELGEGVTKILRQIVGV